MTTIDRAAVIRAAEDHVRRELIGDSSGYDWWHVHRVRNLAITLAREEGADEFVVELAALLHDVADDKFSGLLEAGPQAARDFCARQGLPSEICLQVAAIIARMSSQGAEDDLDLEGRCVRDADRLDAIGAIGIGRTFAYGGVIGRPMWDPDLALHLTAEAGRQGEGSSTIHHYYEKLLVIAHQMNTDAGRRRAAHRHRFMAQFLTEFFDEWDGIDPR